MSSVERVLRTKNLLRFNFIFWSLLCLFEIIKTFSFTQQFDYPFNSRLIFQWPVSAYLMYWILSLAVFQGYVATHSLNKTRFYTIHSISSFIFGITHKLLTPIIALLLDRLFFAEEILTTRQIIPLHVSTWYDVPLSIAVYWMILIVLVGINYYRKFQDQYNQRLELESELSASHLKQMKMQLHPHFLFNAFNTIAMMVRKNKQKEAVNMISSLSEMLRESLKKETTQFVRLEEEIGLLEKYLSIESQRYKDRITIEWDLDVKLNHLKVPNFILQPIVENAFKHGISKNLGNSLLRIHSRMKNGHIELEVYNSGSKLPDNWEFQKDKGIGFANTSTRLMKLYKKDIRFLITEKKDGVSVILHLPVLEKIQD